MPAEGGGQAASGVAIGDSQARRRMDGWEGSALPPPPPADAQEADRSPASENGFGSGNAAVVDGSNSSSGGGSGGDGGLSSSDGSGVPAAQQSTAAAPALANLPAAATHSYLGEATGSSLSRKDLQVGSTIDMPILSLPGVVLFPGESLPLRLHNPAYAVLAESLLGTGAGTEGAGAGGRRRDGESGDGQAARHLGVVNRLDSRSGG